MVIQGNFSLRLINAGTMKPLPEHSSSTGKTFVTLASNVDFLVELEPQVPYNDRSIFYQTTVSNSTTSSHFKRRQTLSEKKPSIFRFDKASKQSYDSVVKEKVTVRVFEVTPDNGKKLLETIMMHCCVLPSIKPRFPERMTSLGTLLAVNTVANAGGARGGCFLKKSAAMATSCSARSSLMPPPSLVL